MLLGCEHCGRVVRPLGKELEDCGKCGRSMKKLGDLEAHDLAREGRIAEQFRARARLEASRSRRALQGLR